MPQPARATAASKPWPLYLSLVLFTLLSAYYSLRTPLLEGSDEPAHFENILLLARGRLPLFAAEPNYEAHQPPLYYAAAALATFWLDASDFPSLVRQNPDTGYDPLDLTNRNLFVHTRREAWPYQGAVLAMHLARLVSLLAGMGALLATCGLARTLFPARPAVWLGATALVAFLPQFQFVSAMISNDSLATLMAALTLWQLARVTLHINAGLRPAPARDLWLLGLLAGLAPLAKESDLALLPFVLLVLALVAWLRVGLPYAIRAAVSVAGLCLLLVGWWYVVRYAALGFWLGSGEGGAAASSLSLEGFFAQWTELEISFWGLLGWNIVPLPQPVYDGLHWLALAALAGLPVALRRWRQWQVSEWAAVGGLWLWMLLILVAFARWMSDTAQAHGRLLFPALPAFAIVLALGLSQWAPRRWQSFISAGFAAAMFLMSGWVALNVLPEAYPLPAVVALEQIPNRLDANLDDRIELLGYELHSERRAGRRVLDVVVYWRATATVELDYTVTVQVFDADGLRIGHLDTYPLSAMHPTTDWRVAEPFRDHYPVEIDPAAPVPVNARVVIGLYDRETNRALQIIEPDGRRAGRLTLGQLELR